GTEGSRSGEGQGSEGRGPLPGGRSCARVFSRRRRREVGRPADRVPRRGAFRSDPKGGYRSPGESTAAVWPRAPVRCETFRPLVGEGPCVSRVPRIRGSMTGAQAPGTVGGRRAHPPRVEKVWAKKVNENERRLARNAALAAVKEV